MKKSNKENKSRFVRHKTVIIGGTVFVIVCVTAGILIYRNPEQAKGVFRAVQSKFSSLFLNNNKVPETLVECTSKEAKTIETVSKEIVELKTDIITKRAYTPCDHPFPVNPHLRKMTGGRQASEEKILQGKEIGLDLLKLGCTIVDGYEKGVA